MKSFYVAAFAILVGLSGCDQGPKKQAEIAPATVSDKGRWKVVPASNAPFFSNGAPVYGAWRLDTKTGDLEFCTFVPGMTVGGSSKAPVEIGVICSNASLASGREIGP